MDISIAMASYNGELFLPSQLDSLASQSLQPSELVITDDGSTDRTAEIVAEFAKKAPFPVRFHRNKTRLGYSDNFLKAASLCRGDLIAFSDQDDVWLSHKLARCAACFQDSSVMLAVHSGEMVDETLKPIGRLFPEIYRDAVTSPLAMPPGRNSSGFAMVFRPSLPLIFHSARPWSSFDQTEPMIHDQWLMFLSHVFGKTAFIHEPLVLYRRHDSTATRPVSLKVNEMIRYSLKSTGDTYSKQAGWAAHRASYLEENIKLLPENQQFMAIQGASHYREIQTILQQRSNLYQTDATLWTRFSSLLNLVARGEYSQRSKAELGFRAFLKDTGLGLLRLDRLFQ